ncbi:uncharacterized protein LOC117123405 isoform X2 [Anneissia japonica]|uniref:uncharacterized protein LOC117123405 isoform X2 n=1 Tax=Anneissia japonica TaxID=1529436 RepID=UPI001425A749|nr:uncharacterized protein LOC117123405 isoform X2 [Anneissia japonica]
MGRTSWQNKSMQLENGEFPSKAGDVTMLPFVKSSSTVSRVQENMRVEQLKKHGSIERPLAKEDNTFWNDGLSMPMFHIEEKKGVLSGKIVRKHGNPLKLSPPFCDFKRDLIHPSMLITRKKTRKEKKQRKLGFNIDEHLAQLKRKQSRVGSNLPRTKAFFSERSVNVTREKLTTQIRMLIPDETESTHKSMDKSQALLEETNEAAQDHCQIDVKFNAPAEIDEFTNPFLRKPRMMYPMNFKNDISTEEENKLKQNTFGKFIVEE